MNDFFVRLRKVRASRLVLALTGFVLILVIGAGALALKTARDARIHDQARMNEFFETALRAEMRAVAENRMAIETLRQELKGAQTKTAQETSGLQQKLKATEQAQRLTESQIEAEKKTTQNNISQLRRDVDEAGQKELTAVIEKWRARVLHIDCAWQFKDGRVVEKTGSGFLFGGDHIATNIHVIEEDSALPQKCVMKLPDDPDTITISGDSDDARIIAKKEDFALVRIKTPTPYMRAIAQGISSHAALNAFSCKARAVSGDSVVVLGYPNIGAESDVTATEGIISGYENPYYITSAKLERGNSGGAAILVTNDCYLGIPTFVRVGGIESLGRILDFAKVYP